MSRVYGLHVAPEHGSRVEVEALDGDIASVEIADRTPDGGLPLNGNYRFTSGRPVLPDHMPTRMRWRGRPGQTIPDFDDGLILNVSGRARGLIEALEPAVHQFLPVTYCDGDGNQLEQRYFLIPCNRLDSLDRERTTMILHRGLAWLPASDLPREELPPGTDPSAEPRMVFNLRRIGRAHLWQDRHLRFGPYISEPLAKALQASGMTGLSWESDGIEAV